MAKQNSSQTHILQMLEGNREAALRASQNVSQDYTLTAKGDYKKTFDYIEKFTGEKSSLATAPDIINNNYIKAQYLEGKKNSQDQGDWGEFGGFAAQAVAGEIVLGTLESVGYLLDVQHWGSRLMGGEGDWGNWFSNYMEEGQNWIKEAAPIYQDPDNANRSTWQNMLHGDGWWAENGVSVASAVSILIPVAGWARGVGLIGKGAKLLGQGARVGKWGGKVAKATKTVDRVMEVFPMTGEATKLAINGIHKATVSRLIESQMEATAVFKERYDYYMKQEGMSEQEAKKAAGEAAAFTYNANWAALVTDIPQYMLLGASGRKLKTLMHTKLPGFIQNSNLLSSTKRVRNLGTTMFTEGLEESYQYIISEEGKRIGDIQAGIVDPNDTTLGQRLGKYMQESELHTSAIFGALGGGVFQTAGPAATGLINKAFRKGELAMTEKDLKANEAKDRYTRLAVHMDLVNNAAKTKDEDAIFTAKSNLAFEMAKEATKVNNWKQARASISQLKNATEEEKQTYGIDDSFDEFMGNIDEWISHMDVASDIVERSREKYTYGLADIVARRQFDKYMYDTQVPKIQNKRDEELKNTISNYDSLSKDGRLAVESAVNIRGMELAIKNLETLLSSGQVETSQVEEITNQINVGKEFINSTKEALNEVVNASEVLTTEDKLALEAINGGTADDAVKLDAKAKILNVKNIQNLKELNYWTSREGRRAFKEIRSEQYAKIKEQAKKDKEANAKKVAQQQAATATESTKTVDVDDLNLTEVINNIDSGKARLEDYTTDPEQLFSLKQKIAHYKLMRDEDENIDDEEAEEDTLLKKEDKVSFNEESLETTEFKEESEPVVVDTLDATETLNAELQAVEAHELIEIPENSSDEDSWRVGDDINDPKLSSIPSQLAWLSFNNSLNYDKTPEQKALSIFLENPSTIISEYKVEFDINQEFIKTSKNPKYIEMLRQLDKGILPSNKDIGFLPIKATITQNGKPVEVNGVKLELNLHDPDFYFKKNGDPKNIGISEYQANVTILHKKAILKQMLDGNKVVTNLSEKTNGKLNVQKNDDGTFAENIVAQTLKKSLDRITFLVGDKSGKFVDSKGIIKMPRLVSAEPGAIYTEVSTANGSRFPLRLKVSNLNEKEAVILHALYVDLLSNPSLITAPISENIFNYINTNSDKRVKDLLSYLPKLKDFTYQELLSHLTYEGSRTIAHKKATLTYFVNTTKDGKNLPNVVQFGESKLTLERLESEKGKEEFINWVTTNKRRQIDLQLLSNKEYKQYLNDNKVLTTNVVSTPEGNLFVQPVISYSTQMQVVNTVTTIQDEISSDNNQFNIEAKKADIEKRRQEELNEYKDKDASKVEVFTFVDEEGNITYIQVRTYPDGKRMAYQGIEKNKYGNVNDNSPFEISKEQTTEDYLKVAYPENSFGKYSKTEERTGEEASLNAYSRKINAKYDAELKALEQQTMNLNETVTEEKDFNETLLDSLKADLEVELGEFGDSVKAAEIQNQINEILLPGNKNVNTILNTINMFKKGIKLENDKELRVNLPEDTDFDENPC